jgi:hypothetical protein
VFTLRVDPHVHLYDTYPVDAWAYAAVRNLGVKDGVDGALIVVDRAGQDSFSRLRTAGGSVKWQEQKTEHKVESTPRVGVLTVSDRAVFVIRGVQYVSAEKLEVLGLGVARSCADGLRCRELIKHILGEGGVVCMPWSPGKWLGPRGVVVKELLEEFTPSDVVFGDIAIHSRGSPPSSILEQAGRAGFRVIRGTDPLPRAADVELVGSYGFEAELEVKPDINNVLTFITNAIMSKNNELRVCGRPNSLWTAARRFLSTL